MIRGEVSYAEMAVCDEPSPMLRTNVSRQWNSERTPGHRLYYVVAMIFAAVQLYQAQSHVSDVSSLESEAQPPPRRPSIAQDSSLRLELVEITATTPAASRLTSVSREDSFSSQYRYQSCASVACRLRTLYKRGVPDRQHFLVPVKSSERCRSVESLVQDIFMLRNHSNGLVIITY
nr:hypothetical protein CFP56_75120 [Quercus suber]